MAILLFVIGLFATMIHMTNVTEQALVNVAADMFQTNNLGDYRRPAELTLVSWIGVTGHVINYTVWLYVALVRYRNEKLIAWCAVAGAVTAMLFGTLIGTAALAAHPEIIEFATQSVSSTPTPTP